MSLLRYAIGVRLSYVEVVIMIGFAPTMRDVTVSSPWWEFLCLAFGFVLSLAAIAARTLIGERVEAAGKGGRR